MCRIVVEIQLCSDSTEFEHFGQLEVIFDLFSGQESSDDGKI
jgi:hypothetical protein